MTSQPEGQTNINELVAAYHRHATGGSAADFWAWDRVGELVRGPDAERAWELVVALIRTAADERLSYVGAGPVEDFVYRHGAALIEWIEGEARRDPRFRHALASIWLVADDVPASLLSRLQSAAGGRILVHTRAEIDEANEGPTA